MVAHLPARRRMKPFFVLVLFSPSFFFNVAKPIFDRLGFPYKSRALSECRRQKQFQTREKMKVTSLEIHILMRP